MISKNTKKIISLAMSITVSGSVIPALTTSAVAVFAEENKTKTEDNNEVKDNSQVKDKLNNISQSTTGQSVNLLDANENSDGYGIDLYADEPWTTPDAFTGEGSIVTIKGIKFTLKDDNTVEISNGKSYSQPELILPEKITIDGIEYEVTDVKNVTFGNKTALEEYYKQNSAAKYSKNDYPEDIYNAYEKSLRKADEVLKDKYVSQEDVDSTLEDFKNAVSELIKIDKNKLIELYGKYKDIKQGNYTSESYGKFTEALKKAETVINNGNAIQNDINNAFKSLQDAVNGLKEKSSSSSSSHRSSSEKTSESEVKSVESVTPEKPDNETSTAIQYKEGWNKNGESWIYVKNGVPAT